VFARHCRAGLNGRVKGVFVTVAGRGLGLRFDNCVEFVFSGDFRHDTRMRGQRLQKQTGNEKKVYKSRWAVFGHRFEV